MKSFNKFLLISLITSTILLVFQCESKERFYLPDLPRKLCTIGVLDIDDTTYYDTFSPSRPGFIPHDSMIFARNIYFEKSFQSEYPAEKNGSLRELSFRISNENKDLIVSQSTPETKNIVFKIPYSKRFEPGRKYFLNASEMECSDISAEITVPELPPDLTLLSIKTGFIMLDHPKEWCYIHNPPQYTKRTVEIEFSFPNNNPASYYAVLLTGSYSDSRVDWSQGWGSNLFNFTVLEGNTFGFFYPFQERRTVQSICERDSASGNDLVYKLYSISAYFIDGSKIPDKNCTLKISTQWANVKFLPHFIKCFRVRLMSIPKELYLFEKSLYTYSRVHNDPFSEPANIQGNIKGGNGVFAICRSRELIVYTGQKGGIYDPYF
jgi:hypothetical protein